MERPSHGNFRASHSFSHRLTSLGLAVSLPLAILFALAHGVGTRIVEHFGPLIYVPEKEPVKPKPPPLPVDMKKIDTVKAVLPDVHIAPAQRDDSGGIAVTQTIVPRTETSGTPGPDRAAAGIASTHTIPPYPLLALRMGVEGKVTLRLTVLTDGKVGSAEIVTSSGRTDLDQAAREWILAHWTYRPALEKGEPVAGEALATVIFSLNNQR